MVIYKLTKGCKLTTPDKELILLISYEFEVPATSFSQHVLCYITGERIVDQKQLVRPAGFYILRHYKYRSILRRNFVIELLEEPFSKPGHTLWFN